MQKKIARALIEELLSLNASEQREREIGMELDRLLPDPEWSIYIFHSDEFSDLNGKVDIDGVVEKAFSYKPIAL